MARNKNTNVNTTKVTKVTKEDVEVKEQTEEVQEVESQEEVATNEEESKTTEQSQPNSGSDNDSSGNIEVEQNTLENVIAIMKDDSLEDSKKVEKLRKIRIFGLVGTILESLNSLVALAESDDRSPDKVNIRIKTLANNLSAINKCEDAKETRLSLGLIKIYASANVSNSFRPEIIMYAGATAISKESVRKDYLFFFTLVTSTDKDNISKDVMFKTSFWNKETQEIIKQIFK